MKKIIIFIVVTISIVCVGIYAYDYTNTFRIDKSKIRSICFYTDIKYDKISKETLMGEYDISKLISQRDKDNIYHCLNDGKLVPNKKIAKNYDYKHIEINANGLLDVYMSKNDEFVVIYSLHPYSNGSDHDDQTMIESKTLKKYFIKWQKQVKQLKPVSIWKTKY